MKRFLTPAAGMVLALSGVLCADTVELDLTRHDPDTWELQGVPAEAFTPEGLRLKIDELGKEIALLSKRVFRGRLIVTMDYEIVKGPTRSDLMLRLDNPEKRRRMDLGERHYYSVDGQGKVTSDYGGSFLRYYKDGKLTAERGHGDPQNRLILIKEGLRLYGSFGVPPATNVVGAPPEPTSGTMHYPAVYFGEDCEEYRVGVAATTMRGERFYPFEALVRKITVWGPEVKVPEAKVSGPFVPPELPDEEKVLPPSSKVWRFDFGPVAQEIERGCIPVNPRTNYTTDQHYGWLADAWVVDHEWEYKQLPDEEAPKHGLWPTSPRSAGWRRGCERAVNYMILHKLRGMTSGANGFTKIEYFDKYFDLIPPAEQDLVNMFRPYGCTYDYRTEADLWELRGAFYVSDDLSTEFRVDLPNDRYSMLIGVGFNPSSLLRSSPFSIEAEGLLIKKHLGANWRRCNYFRVDDVEVKDGQLNLRFFADRRLAMNRLEPWAEGVTWQINYLTILPSELRDDIRREEWKIILDRGERIRRVTFAPGEPLIARVHNDYLVVNEKPIIPVLWQFWQPPDTYDHYPYYLWGNTNAIINIAAIFRGSQHFFKSDWFKFSAVDDYPWQEIDRMNITNRQGKVFFVRVDGMLNFVPRAIEGEGGRLEDSRRRQDRWNAQPPLNSRLGREMQRESRAMASFQIRRHPSLVGSYIYEELWHPQGKGYDFQSLTQYHDYLEKKYGTIDKLNAEWTSSYTDFGEIKPPPDWEESANWRNFRAFRMWSQVQDVKYSRDLLDVLEPEHLTFGAKGDYATASWYYAPFIKLFAWYSGNTARIAALHNRHAPGCPGSLFYCPYVYVDGRKQLDHKPGEKQYQGKDGFTLYTKILGDLFDGVKGFYCEEYNDSFEHMFHRTKQLKWESSEGLCKKWTGHLGFFDDEAYDYPEVTVDEPPLQFTSAMALTYRLTPILCPAKNVRPSVAVYITDESFFLGTGNGVWATRSLEKLLKRLQAPYDLLRDEIFDRVFDYEVLIVGSFSESVRPDRAEKIREFVKRGGKLILLEGAATRNALSLKRTEVLPGFGLADIADVKMVDISRPRLRVEEPVMVVKNAFAPSFKGGETIYPDLNQPGWKLELAEGAQPLVQCKDLVLGACNRDGTVLTLVHAVEPESWVLQVERDFERTDVYAKLLGDFFARWKPKLCVEVSGCTKREAIDADVLYAPPLPGEPGTAAAAHGYWLVGLANAAREPQTLNVKMPSLPKGEYEVTDVTGERPLIGRKPDRGLKLSVDPERRYVDVLARRVSADELAGKGLTLTLEERGGKVLLVRPADWKVWTAVPEYTVNSLTSRPVTVVVGRDAPEGERKAAERIRDAVAARGVTAKVVDASDVKIEKKRHEVWIASRFPGAPPLKDYKGYLTDVFETEPVVTDDTLVVVGSEATNPLVRHLGKVGTFTYDKVLEKVTASHPGAGRGIIQMVDSVNFPYYDATANTRDALLVGGSDAAGTVLAADHLVTMLKAMGEPWKRPEIEQMIDFEKLPRW